MKTLMRVVVPFCSLFLVHATAVWAGNIGVAGQLTPNARALDITRMLSSLIGSWNGTYQYFDERAGK